MKKGEMQVKILSETGAMFFRHGIRTVRMDDIAANLGVSKKTIYLYYKDKDQLVKSFTDEELRLQEKRMHEMRSESKNSVEEILKVMAHLGNFYKTVNPSVFYDLQKYHPDAWNSFKVFKQRVMIGFVEDNLRKGIKQNLYRKELKVKVLARLRIEQVEMGMNPRVFPPGSFSITETQLALIDHFLHGIVTIKGFRLIARIQKKQKRKS